MKNIDDHKLVIQSYDDSLLMTNNWLEVKCTLLQ